MCSERDPNPHCNSQLDVLTIELQEDCWQDVCYMKTLVNNLAHYESVLERNLRNPLNSS